MKILHWILVILVVFVAVSAGLAKAFQIPQEVQFLSLFGFNVALIIVYGIVQTLGGILMLIPKTLTLGALITTLAFILSSVLILISGDLMFFIVSLIPVALTYLTVWSASKAHNIKGKVLTEEL